MLRSIPVSFPELVAVWVVGQSRPPHLAPFHSLIAKELACLSYTHDCAETLVPGQMAQADRCAREIESLARAGILLLRSPKLYLFIVLVVILSLPIRK